MKRQNLSQGLVDTFKIVVFPQSNDKLFKGFKWEVINVVLFAFQKIILAAK